MAATTTPSHTKMMQLASAATPSATAYAKVDKMDAEEARHLKAQYLIHKVLEEAPAAARPPRRPPALAMVEEAPAASRPPRRPPALARIGVRLKKLRLAIRSVRVRALRAVQRHLRSLRRLVARGGQGSAVKPVAAVSPS